MVDGIEAWPPFWLRLWDLLEAGEYYEADRLWYLFADSFGPYFTRVLSRSGSDGCAAKGMARIMGAGPGAASPSIAAAGGCRAGRTAGADDRLGGGGGGRYRESSRSRSARRAEKWTPSCER